MSVLNYERFLPTIWEHIHVFGEEKVLVCHAFRWRLNGDIVSNGYEMFSPERICEDNGLDIITKISEELVIVRPKPAAPQPAGEASTTEGGR